MGDGVDGSCLGVGSRAHGLADNQTLRAVEPEHRITPKSFLARQFAKLLLGLLLGGGILIGQRPSFVKHEGVGS